MKMIFIHQLWRRTLFNCVSKTNMTLLRLRKYLLVPK